MNIFSILKLHPTKIAHLLRAVGDMNGSFERLSMPLVFFATGSLGNECKTFHKGLPPRFSASLLLILSCLAVILCLAILCATPYPDSLSCLFAFHCTM